MQNITDPDYVELVASAFEERGLKLSESLLNAVMKRVLRLTTKDGLINSDTTNRDVIAETKDLLNTYFNSSFYSDFAPELISELGEIEKSSEYFLQLENGVQLTGSFKAAQVNPVRRQFAQNIAESFGKDLFNQTARNPIIETLLEATQFGYTLEKTQKLLKSKTDRFGSYTGQVVRDSTFRYDGEINAVFAKEIGANAYRYIGSIIADSRPQCRRWVKKKTLLESDLPKEIAWANKRGSGMVPGTNTKNFPLLRGGYNCRHRAIPIILDNE